MTLSKSKLPPKPGNACILKIMGGNLMKKQYYLPLGDEHILVATETYYEYNRPLWREHKRKEREKRCSVSNGRGGIKRCTGDCSKCDKQRTGAILSIDRFTDEGFEVPDTFNMEEMVADKLLFEQLVAALDDLEPGEWALINALFHNNRTERDYAAEIGISHQAVGKRKKKVVEKLRNLLGTDET